MDNSGSVTILRNELRRILIAMHVDDKNIEALFSSMEKGHRHVNVIAFVSSLEKINLSRDQIANVLRRIGISDVAISNIFEMVDVQKISAEIGKVYNINVGLS
ncbi:MAG: hypothetical protein ACP5MX_02120 [Candidatus Micrarchaeia archaeon]